MIKLTIAEVEVNALTEHDAITITPDEAKRLLEQDNRNFRKVSRGEVAKHINSMKEGKWRFNGDSIALDASGLVKDGQHRLIACMESQIPMKVFLLLLMILFILLSQKKTIKEPLDVLPLKR